MMMMNIISSNRRVVTGSFNRLLMSTTVKFQPSYGLFVDGKLVHPEGCKYFDVKSPANLQYLSKVVSASPADVNNAVEVAQKAFDSGVWSRMDVRERSKILYKIADNLRANIPRLAEMEVEQTGRAVR